jgi:hypothetical protein
MIAAFVRAELESLRFGAALRSTLAELGMSVELVSAPPSVAGATEARRQLLTEYRGWGQSYLANPDLVTFPILSMVGTSARMAEWSEW